MMSLMYNTMTTTGKQPLLWRKLHAYLLTLGFPRYATTKARTRMTMRTTTRRTTTTRTRRRRRRKRRRLRRM